MTGKLQIPARKARALNALLTCHSIGEASRQSNVSEPTIYRWLREDDEFKEAYRQGRCELVEHALSLAQQCCAEAVEILRAIARDVELPSSSRVTAATRLIEFSAKAVEYQQLEARIEALEKSMNGGVQ